ncbi:MAG: NUDIX domain-containing protein [Chitinispirillaceae bacterium]
MIKATLDYSRLTNYFQTMKSFTQFSYCPRCASPKIDVYMKNAIKCEACGYIYFHNTAAAVAAIVEIGGKILLIRRAHEPKAGFFDLPGGFVDYKESIDEAIVREVKEECNLDIVDLRYFGSFANTYHYCGVDYFTADTFFLCRPVEAKMLSLSDEISEFVIIDNGAVDMKTIAFDSIKAALEKYKTIAAL